MKYLVFSAAGVLIAGLIYLYSGAYPVGADVPHNKFTYWFLETVREQSIAKATKAIQVPSLGEPELLLVGGPDYDYMCAICHLKPGKTHSDMSIGLYPKPPNLSKKEGEHGHTDDGLSNSKQRARRQFWIIKHGIKASGMPAWGPTHDDQRIWAMVAFLQKLPELTPEQYQILTAQNESSGHTPH